MAKVGTEVEMLRKGAWKSFRDQREIGRQNWFDKVPPRPTWKKEGYMEDQQFIMPLLEDGVVSVGELYNIRESRLLGANLIHYNQLTTDHLVAHPRKDLEYRFDYISDHMDLLDTLHVDASVKVDLEFSGGTIKIGVFGRAIVDKGEKRTFWEDEIRCTYRNETFSIQLQPSAFFGPKQILNTEVYQKLLTGKLDATHICTEVILGGESIINLYMKKDDQKENLGIDGTLDLDIKIKKSFSLGIKVKAHMDLVNNATYSHKDDRIYVYSKPPFKTQPNTVEEMIKNIKDIPNLINEERHFRMFKESNDFPEVTGVPIRYKLTPLDRVVDFPESFVLRKSFRLVEPALLNEFLIMLATLSDFLSKDFVKRKIYEREPRLLTMLQDQDNPITMRISAWETELSSRSKVIKTRADFVYQEYKQTEPPAEADPVPLREVITLFNEAFDVVRVYQGIEEFRRESKKEIVGVHISDADEDIQVTFLTNEIDRDDWYGSERRTKILLHTGSEDGTSPAGTFLRLFNMSSHLKTLGADVGVAYPSISNGFKLCIKTNAVESIYQYADIPFALEILGLAVGKAENVPRLFWTVNGALTGIRLPLEDNISDIPSLIAINKELQDVKVCPTYLMLREEIAKKDGRVKIVLEVKALESVADSILFFRKLRAELEKEPAVVPVDWAVGTFDMDKFHDAPIAFAFLDGQLFSVCLDNLDVLILLEQLRSLTPDFELLKAENLRAKCMYPNRGNFGMQVAELLGQYHGSMTDRVQEMESFARPIPEGMSVYEYLEKFEGLLDTMFVNRELLSGDELRVISAIASICMRTFPQMLTNLKSMGWNEASNSFNPGLLPSNWIQVSNYLKEFLENENPLLAKAEYLRQKFTVVLEAYEKGENTDPAEAIESINVILEHENPPCPPDLRQDLESYNSAKAKPEMILKGYVTALTTFCEKEFSKDEYFDLRHFMNFSAILRETGMSGLGSIVPDTVGLYIQRVLSDPVLDKFPGADKKLGEYLEQKRYFQTLSLMSKIQYDHKLFMIHQCFYLLLDIEDTDDIKRMVNKMGEEEFEDPNYEDLWKNRKFSYYMLKGVNSQSVLEAVAMYQCEKGVVPTHMPVEFEEKLIPMLLADDDLIFEWKQDWDTIEDALKVFQAITVRKSIPKAFPEKLRENIENNKELRTALETAGALYYWDDIRSILLQPWDIPTISKVVDKLMDHLKNIADNEALRQLETVEISTQEEVPVEEVPSSYENDLIIKDQWYAIAENVSPKMDLAIYHRLTEILAAPVINHRELNKAMSKILPYVIQRSKNLSVDPLSPSSVYNYVKYPQQLDVNVPGIIDFGDSEEEQRKIPMVSRGDILTYLFNSSHPVVGNNVIQLIGKNPSYSLPLAVQDIDSTVSGNQFILLYKQLKNIPIKWEPIPGEIAENNLFANPFRLTVVVRLGENNWGDGKSPIVNSIMAPPHNAFSSVKDSLSELQRPVSHPGFVELSWLTKETCKDTFWQKLQDSYYSKFHASGSNEVLLLANLHGDGIEHYKILIELNRIGANFLALLMPDSWENMRDRAMKLTTYLGSKDNVLFAFVDPIRGVVEENRYSKASVISTLETVREGKTTVLETLLLKSFDSTSIPYLDDGEHVFTGLQEIETVESRYLLSLVKKHSCRTVRQILKLHSLEQYNHSEFVQAWNDNEDLQELIRAYQNILRLPANKREGSLAHVKQELSILSRESSMKIRKEVLQLIDELKISVEAEIPILNEIRNLHNQVKALRVWIDERTLGLEHFFREIGRCHEAEEFQQHMMYAGRYADHILKGNEVELFNRDAGDIFWGKWLQDVFFQSMPPEFKDYRIFVVSIIGLISSGKSTLLNALFGCKFSVSIGGGTRGIFMKLLFLEDRLRDQLKVDVIVLLDTQGISTIGNVGDDDTLQKEQQLIALTVGLSNLTLLNSRGIQLGNMTNVLESVFAKLTTVEELAFIPDFLLVHHQTAHRHMQTQMAIADLTDALRAVSDLTENNELNLGVRDRIGRRLNKIMRRVKHRDIVHQISPLMTAPTETSHPSKQFHESVVQLYGKILETCQESDKILTFGEWYGFSQKLWQNLTCHKDNFPLRFTNSTQTQDYINLQKKIADIKDLIDWAFLSHEEGWKKEIADIEKTTETENILEEGVEQEEVEIEANDREDRRRTGLGNIWKALRKMAGTCERSLEKGQKEGQNEGQPEEKCQPCTEALQAKESLLAQLKGSNFRFETQETLNNYIVEVRTSIWNRLNQSLMAWEMTQCDENPKKVDPHECSKTLNIFYNEAIEEVKGLPDRWKKIQQLIAPKILVIPAETQIINEVAEYYRNLPHLVTSIENKDELQGNLPDLGAVKAFDLGYYNAIRVFELEVEDEEEDEEEKTEDNENGEGETPGDHENGENGNGQTPGENENGETPGESKNGGSLEKSQNGESSGENENAGDEVDCGCKGDKEQTPYLDWSQKDWIEAQIKDVSELMWQSRCYDPVDKEPKWVYEVGMIRELQARVVKILDEFEERTREKLLPNFKWEAHIYGILYFISYMGVKQEEWDTKNLPLLQIHDYLLIPTAAPKPDSE